jgi:hypothetical protein
MDDRMDDGTDSEEASFLIPTSFTIYDYDFSEHDFFSPMKD